jgi:hypothetical protein
MSKSCQGLLQEFVRCLLNSDCVKVQHLLRATCHVLPVQSAPSSLQKRLQCLHVARRDDLVDDVARPHARQHAGMQSHACMQHIQCVCRDDLYITLCRLARTSRSVHRLSRSARACAPHSSNARRARLIPALAFRARKGTEHQVHNVHSQQH